MAYDPAGNYSLPPSYKAVAGQLIRTENHNPPLEDIAQALSSALVRDGRNGMVGNLNMGSFQIKNLKPGADNTDAATVGQALGSGPVGMIALFAGDNAPTGWMLCFGQAISRTDYAACFSALGTKFGAGNGTTTFNLPDMRGTIGVGLDNMGGTPANRVTPAGSGINAIAIGARGGVQSVSLTEAQMPSHGHTGSTGWAGRHTHRYLDANIGGVSSGLGITTSNGAARASLNAQTSLDGDHAHDFTTNSAGGGQAHNNMPPVLVLNYIIRVSA